MPATAKHAAKNPSVKTLIIGSVAGSNSQLILLNKIWWNCIKKPSKLVTAKGKITTGITIKIKAIVGVKTK